MYAIFEDGGHQYRVEKGDRLLLGRRDAEPGSDLVLSKVLLANGQVGTPTLPDASITAKVLGEVKGEKIYVQKFKRRKNYRRRTGHRQRFTEVEVLSIDVSDNP